MSWFKRSSPYLKNFRFQSIFYQNLLMLALFALLPMVLIASVSWFYYNDAIQKAAADAANRAISHLEKVTDQVTVEVIEEIQRIVVDDAMVRFLMERTSLQSSITQENLALASDLRALVARHNAINGIYLYNRERAIVGSRGIVPLASAQAHPMVIAYEQYLAKAGGNHRQYDTFFWEDAQVSGGAQTLTFACPFVSEKLQRSIVFVSVDFGRVLAEDMTDISDYDATIVLTASDRVIYREGAEAEAVALGLSPPDGEYMMTDIQGETYLAMHGALFLDACDFWLFISQSTALESVQWLLPTFTLMVGISFVLLMLLAYQASVRMYNPILRLLESVEKLPAATEPEGQGDEIAYITRTLAHSVERHTVNEAELQNRVEMFRKAQYLALQSQINPHFIYNTLDNINWMAVMKLGGENEISEMTTGLARLFALSTGSGKSVHPLRDEIEHAKLYLQIMLKRYSGQFKVEWAVDHELGDVEVPKVTLQPLLENAIYHGIKPRQDEDGLIRVRIFRSGDWLEIHMIDNGPGFLPSDRVRLNEGLQTMKMIPEDGHIGLGNINMRLKLLFGEESGVIIAEREAAGCVVVRLPISGGVKGVSGK